MDVARRRSPLPEASVFEPHVERAAAPSLPADLERLGVEVRAFSVPLEAGATQVPGALRRACRVIAAGRLARHGDLRLDEPSDAAACAEACGPDLWAALDGQPTAMDPDALCTRDWSACDRPVTPVHPGRHRGARRCHARRARARRDRQARRARARPARPPRRRARPPRRPARRGQDADRPLAGHRHRPRVRPRAVHARPAARRHHGRSWCSIRRTSDVVFRPGPVFANLVLADEVNRAPAKTQAALLEAMQERQVTADGVTHALPRPFLVIATQNPIEYEGTYPLPEAQLDRFILRTTVGYPTPDDEWDIVRPPRSNGAPTTSRCSAVASPTTSWRCSAPSRRVHVEESDRPLHRGHRRRHPPRQRAAGRRQPARARSPLAQAGTRPRGAAGPRLRHARRREGGGRRRRSPIGWCWPASSGSGGSPPESDPGPRSSTTCRRRRSDVASGPVDASRSNGTARRGWRLRHAHGRWACSAPCCRAGPSWPPWRRPSPCCSWPASYWPSRVRVAAAARARRRPGHRGRRHRRPPVDRHQPARRAASRCWCRRRPP